MLKSSILREAEAIRRILVSNLAVFDGTKLKIYSDNKNVKLFYEAAAQIRFTNYSIANLQCV